MQRTCLFALASVFLSLSASAQLTLARNGGTIGQSLTIEVAGKANAAFFLLPSATAGPTPLKLLDPTDPRSLEVGLDLTSLIVVGVLTTQPTKVAYPIPNVPGFAGLTLYFHAFSFPGTKYLVSDVSNPVRQVLGNPNKWLARGKVLSVPRGFSTLSQLKNGNHLIAAGGDADLATFTFKAVNSTEIYDRDRQRYTPGPNLTTARVGHQAARLTNGDVLMIGGVDNSGNVLRTCERYLAASNTIVPTGSMASPRFGHTATLLANGNVLVTGGTSTTADTTVMLNGMKKSTEIYNPTTHTWSAGPTLRRHRMLHAAIRLPDNRVLVSAGLGYTNLIFIKIPVTLGECDIINATGTGRSSGGSHRSARLAHALTLLPNGQVLATGGAALQSFTNIVAIGKAETFSSGSWTATGNLPTAVAGHNVTIAADGRAVVQGGLTGSLTTATSTANCAYYNTASRTFSAAPAMATSRALAASLLTPGGQILIVGGGGSTANRALDVGERLFH